MYREKFITLVIKRLKRVANKFYGNDYFNKQLFFLLLDNIHNDNILDIIEHENMIICNIYQKIIISTYSFDAQYEFRQLWELWDILYGLILYINDSSISNLKCLLFLIKHDLKNVNNFYSTVPSPNSVIASK